MQVEDVDSDSDCDWNPDDDFEDCKLSDSDESDATDKDIENKYQEEEQLMLLLFLCTFGIIFSKEKKPRRKRVKKTIDERSAPWLFIETWTERMFYRQFRMFRAEFFELLQRMIDVFPGPYDTGHQNYEYSCQQGDNSWGAHIPLQIKLCVTLRILAGASYLDMIWYGCSVNHVEAFFVDMLKLIDLALPIEFIFNFDAGTDFNEMANEWTRIMERKRGCALLRGTILAGDGLVVQIEGLSTLELDTICLDDDAFRNRKGYFGLIVQAFCDAFCMFRYFEMSWPGATPDITAYKQTALYRMFMAGTIPEGFHMVLDEAYSSVSDEQHLSPFTKAQLDSARTAQPDLYNQMKTFNNILSSQRITIERAFGMLVRKFGILWRALRYDLATNILVVQTCAKLHNWCIRAWKKSGSRSQEVRDIQASYDMCKDAGIFCGWTTEEYLLETGISMPDDVAIRDRMENLFPAPAGTRARRNISKKKQRCMNHMFLRGFMYDLRSDDAIRRLAGQRALIR
jgi:hypothetical protein